MDKDKQIIQLIDAYWKFDEQQQPISSWHDKQDLLKVIESELASLKSQPEPEVEGAGTAEEFFRNKLKQKHPEQKVITLSGELITAEEGMRWAHDFARQSLGSELIKYELWAGDFGQLRDGKSVELLIDEYLNKSDQ